MTDQTDLDPVERTSPLAWLLLAIACVGFAVMVGIGLYTTFAQSSPPPQRRPSIDDYLPPERGGRPTVDELLNESALRVRLSMYRGELAVHIGGEPLDPGDESLEDALKARVRAYLVERSTVQAPPVVISATTTVGPAEIVRVVDAAMAAGAKNVTFEGSAPK